MDLTNLLRASLTFVSVFSVLLLFSFYYRRFRETQITVVKAKCTFTIADPTGIRATLTKFMRIRANQEIAEYVHRNLSADGSM